MESSIVDLQTRGVTYNYYDVYFYNDRIDTLVTHDPDMVSNWLYHTQRIHQPRQQNLIFGLDVEWRPNFNNSDRNSVATLQLCIGHRCLVFQILRCSREYNTISRTLHDFLGDDDFTFVGVGIKEDVEKLKEDYGLSVNGKIMDLRDLVAWAYNDTSLKNNGLKGLAMLVLRKKLEKPSCVTLGNWDNILLTSEQVKYACIDAFVSFDIGMRFCQVGSQFGC